MQTDANDWIEIMPATDLAEGAVIGVEIGAHAIAIYHLSDGTFHATDNICTHALALLSEGWLEGGTIECPLHGGCFDIRTGKGLCAPITDDLATYPVAIRDGMIHVALKD